MKSFFTLSALALMVVMTGNAQPLLTHFDTPAEQAQWTNFSLGATPPNNQWNFDSSASVSSPYSMVHYYPVGGTVVTDDWFVSPAFDFSNGGIIDSLRYRFSGFGVPQSDDTVAIYVLHGSNDPTLASQKILIHDFRDSNYTADGVWRLLENVEIQPDVALSSYIAFRYHTIVNWLDVKFDNLRVTPNVHTGISEKDLNAKSLMIAPNPVENEFRVALQSGTNLQQLNLYNALGQQVISFSPPFGYHDLSNLESGIYWLVGQSEGQSFSSKLVKR